MFGSTEHLKVSSDLPGRQYMSVSEAPKPAFRLSQLIYDSRYRSITIQVVTLALFCLGLWWLGNNAYTNLDKLGLTPDFSFLQSRAGYDIGETLIPYDSSSTHGRAALVGILNTLLLAAMGCATALVIGVIAGVLRLSKNWVVSKLMSVYVEGFRNVPLLLWIFLIFAIFTESRPPPNTFKPNADGIGKMKCSLVRLLRPIRARLYRVCRSHHWNGFYGLFWLARLSRSTFFVSTQNLFNLKRAVLCLYSCQPLAF